MTWVIVVAACAFGIAAVLSVRLCAVLCAGIEPFDDGPTPGTPPSRALVAGATLLGAALAWRDPAWPTLGIAVVIVASLVAVWYSDVRCGIVLDSFTLGPLALVIGLGLARGSALPLVSALVVAAPFAVAAYLSHGRGMGWGDVKLVALGAAALGFATAVLAFAVAGVIAVAIAVVRGRRSEPIAFAPYLAGAIAVALVVPSAP
ncbi:MAG: hypothetical protein NVS1B2_21460 [Vulcanimicrobiaceae bacterium]